ncbi:MAG TPA: GAP family protein [Streptosporangiaceae bacterium]|nr:GAP family protein [Streptosporangiaceae bacterium]
MLAQAAGLAVLAALSPTTLLIAAVYLGSPRPRLISAYYLAGALLMSATTGVIVLAALRGGGLARPGEHTPRYGLRLGLGILALAMGLVIAARKPKPPGPEKPRTGVVSRMRGVVPAMAANPAPLSAFAAGLVLFAPSVTFVAAVQAIATARASLALSALALAIVVVIGAMLVWLPILAHLAAPDWTSRTLTSFNGWLRAHGHALLPVAVIAVGVILTAQGLAGLVQGK